MSDDCLALTDRIVWLTVLTHVRKDANAQRSA
jgi:hypothetical protein